MNDDLNKPNPVRSVFGSAADKAKDLASDIREIDDDTHDRDLNRIAAFGLGAVFVGLCVLWFSTGLIFGAAGGILTVGGLVVAALAGVQAFKNASA